MSHTAQSSTNTHYDLIVIGSGPAGEKGAAQAAYFGKRVALVEKEPYLGGAAANTGTLPSKTLRETALYLSGFRQRGLYGIEANLRERATVQDFLRRERLVKNSERERIATNLTKHGIDLHTGAARFTAPHTVTVGDTGTVLTADTFLIATGSRPHRPEPYPFADACVYDSDEILSLERIPGSLIVVGGGVIGCEYACIFAALGTKVTLLESRPQLLSFLDDEIVAVLQERMIYLGVRFVLGDTVTEVVGSENCKTNGESRADGTSDGGYTVHLASGGVMEGETILVAAGRTGNTDTLGLETVGVAVGKRGLIPVDAQFRTNIGHVFAAGDVVGNPALASAAMEQGRLAMCHAFHLSYKQAMPPILPYGIYTIPEVSAAGETEEDAVSKGIPVVVGRARLKENARGEIIGEEHGLLKLVFRLENTDGNSDATPDMTLIGCHIIGEQASELVHIGLTVMLAQQGADLFLQTCYNYPTLSEAYKYATYDALGNLSRQSHTAKDSPSETGTLSP